VKNLSLETRLGRSRKAGAFSFACAPEHGQPAGLEKINIVFLQKNAFFFDKTIVHR
jgi:hypothetical protein